MTILHDYQQFDGLHWETGTVRSFLDYIGSKAPHTGQPFTEALLMGVSGGAVMGYFTFAYAGHDPMARILTRNTFDPWDTMLSRLGIVQEARHTFGLAAYEHWIKLLTKPKNRLSWAKQFPAGRPMYAGLTTQFEDINLYGKDGKAERDLYADFLAEAAIILAKPVLNKVAGHFRSAGQAWDKLSQILLPENHPLLAETRQILCQRHQLFLSQGSATNEERLQLSRRLEAIRDEIAENFDLSEPEIADFRARISEQVTAIHKIEAQAIADLKEAMS